MLCYRGLRRQHFDTLKTEKDENLQKPEAEFVMRDPPMMVEMTKAAQADANMLEVTDAHASQSATTSW